LSFEPREIGSAILRGNKGKSRTISGMYYVYILQSTVTKEIYIGFTSNLKKRVIQHNTNLSFSTKNKGPWVIIYYESVRSKDDAREREHQLKFYGRTLVHLKRRLKKSLLMPD